MILDLGCGDGHNAAEHEPGGYVGVDIDHRCLAASPWKERGALICARGERLPFRDCSFSAIRSGVAIPYMDIPKVAAELYRVAKPGATVYLSAHSIRQTFRELSYVRRVVPLVYRLYVLVNGLCFHATGKVFRFPLKRSRVESFQTRRSLTRVMRSAGFTDAEIVPRYPLTVAAKKPRQAA